MNKSDNSLLGMILGDTEKACNNISRLPEEMPIAMAYVPYQMWDEPYETDVALMRGTIFPELDKPFVGEEAVKNGYPK